MLLVEDRTIAGLKSLGAFITGLLSSKGKAEDSLKALCSWARDLQRQCRSQCQTSSNVWSFSCAVNMHVHSWNKGVLMLTDEQHPWVILTHPTIPVPPGQLLFEWQYMGISANHWILMRLCLFVLKSHLCGFCCFGLGFFLLIVKVSKSWPLLHSITAEYRTVQEGVQQIPKHA